MQDFNAHSNAQDGSVAAKAMDAETLQFIQGVFELVRAGDADRLQGLVDKGMPANFRNQKGDSLIMLAAYHGHLDTARVLLKAGADPQVQNDMGQTPLAGAAYKGNLPMAQLLLEHGAHVEGISPDGKTAAMFAAMFNRTEILELLLERGADMSARDSRGMGLLDLAKHMGAANTAALLESKGAT